MGHRIHSRRSNGRFRQATLENTFGLHCEWCPACRTGNPYKAGEPKPERCHACGASLAAPSLPPAAAEPDPFDFDSDLDLGPTAE